MPRDLIHNTNRNYKLSHRHKPYWTTNLSSKSILLRFSVFPENDRVIGLLIAYMDI